MTIQKLSIFSKDSENMTMTLMSGKILSKEDSILVIENVYLDVFIYRKCQLLFINFICVSVTPYQYRPFVLGQMPTAADVFIYFSMLYNLFNCACFVSMSQEPIYSVVHTIDIALLIIFSCHRNESRLQNMQNVATTLLSCKKYNLHKKFPPELLVH